MLIEGKMGILFESDSYIEILLKEALIKENINFHEQFKVYSFGDVKYVVDFLVTNKDIKVIVECDGFHFHAGSKRLVKQKERDEWLKNKGYIILHFSTNDIKMNIIGVIETIKFNLELPCDSSKIIKKQKRKTDIKGFEEKKTNPFETDVTLFCFYKQNNNDIYVVYKYRDNRKNHWSEERKKICHNVPDEMLETTVFYISLLDLKKTVKLRIYYHGKLYCDDYSVSKKVRSHIKAFPKGNTILNKNQISFSHVGFHGDYRFNKKEPQKTLTELKSRCFQFANNPKCCIASYDYRNLIDVKEDTNYSN